ncbi:hypothetical protein [Actinocorallia longicatena]|uniref:Uncharacterized protein n=1 Tax=Actinocorallia longicatena TaxID=111803 RepID=A0ABP6QGN2_9ACTN
MDIQLAFTAPQRFNGDDITELPLTADRLTVDGPTLRAFRKNEQIAETPLSSLSEITFPTRRDLTRIRETSPNAFRPWTKAADTELLTLRRNGADTPTLSTHFGRGRNAVLQRLDKLGALTP